MKTNRGQTTPVQGETQERSPRQPHERDESAASQERQEPSQERVGGQAHDDLERGLTDTDKGPVIDEAYEKQFRRPGPGASRR